MVTKQDSQVELIVTKLDNLDSAIRALVAKQQELKADIERIERLGWVDAKPHYREDKYLYLIYPMVDGQRKREYIGANPENIQAAMDRIERKAQYDELHNQLARVENVIGNVRSLVIRAVGEAYSIKW